jgi:hypothetical protein
MGPSLAAERCLVTLVQKKTETRRSQDEQSHGPREVLGWFGGLSLVQHHGRSDLIPKV